MSDKLVFDLAQEVEGSPNVFIRKDWLNILDNQNQNYNNNQSVIDTSQLSNSNKYMSYREAYLSIPFLVTVAQTSTVVGGTAPTSTFSPGAAASSADYSVGLKNWFGQIIHSFTLDYNGTTIIQQTPYVNMWNSFKLMTSLSLDDVNTQGATIGFYPDDALTWAVCVGSTGVVLNTSLSGNGVSNNTNFNLVTAVSGQFNNFRSQLSNSGFVSRQQLINFDINGRVNDNNAVDINTYATLLQNAQTALNNCWKSYISNKVNGPVATSAVSAVQGCIQYSVVATVYLKQLHSFFNMCPLLKGVFMKMTMNLNNTSSTIQTIYTNGDKISMSCSNVSNPLGGVNPLMVASGITDNGGVSLFPTGGDATTDVTNNFKVNISVGAVCLDQSITSANDAARAGTGALSKSIYLYVPAYTFNPVFEQAYMSSPVKSIKYTDVYQYQIVNQSAGATFTQLLTNGIANVKSVLILPFYNSGGVADANNNSPNSGFVSGSPVFQSPFDPAGTGPTSPLCWITNFNVQVSGQNAIYNMERYNFEQFNNQLYGQNAVNGGLTDGITSGLIDRQRFDMEYCYYYVNIERMLPVEQSVPKSIQVLGQNQSSRAVDYYCFVEYGNEISIDIITGARV